MKTKTNIIFISFQLLFNYFNIKALIFILSETENTVQQYLQVLLDILILPCTPNLSTHFSIFKFIIYFITILGIIVFLGLMD